jgi:hypothetical protein
MFQPYMAIHRISYVVSLYDCCHLPTTDITPNKQAPVICNCNKNLHIMKHVNQSQPIKDIFVLQQECKHTRDTNNKNYIRYPQMISSL